MKLGGTKTILSMLYDDKMDVSRYITSTNLDGTTETSMNPEKVYENIPCRVSFSNVSDSPDDVQVDSNPVDFSPRLFCSPDIALATGDYIEVKRKDDKGNTILVYKGNIGMPAWYSNHQEVKFNIEEFA